MDRRERDRTTHEVFRGAYDGRLDEIAETLVGRLSALPTNPFRDARGDRFDVAPARVNEWLNEMAAGLAEQTELRSIYVEMNGFSINPDRWFCDAFGYSSAIVVTNPLDDPGGGWFEQLTEWDAELHSERALTLTGMDSMQAAFRWAKEEGRLGEEASELADWLVQCRFLALIRDGVAAGPIQPAAPVAAATHGSDLVLQFHPA